MSDALRIFECWHCGHKLRFGARRCGECYSPTPIWNRSATMRLLTAMVVIFLGGVGLAVLA